MAIPVNNGLINLKKETTVQGQFKGVARDISMKRLRLELKYTKAAIRG
jgi:hypothetical protein